MNAVINFPVPEVSMIDELAELDSKIKFYTEQSKKLKDKIANFYGEGKHRGNTFGVNVSLYQSTTYDYKKMIADLGITQDTLSQYAKHNATIRVSVTA
jgi:hypothetical protein